MRLAVFVGFMFFSLLPLRADSALVTTSPTNGSVFKFLSDVPLEIDAQNADGSRTNLGGYLITYPTTISFFGAGGNGLYGHALYRVNRGGVCVGWCSIPGYRVGRATAIYETQPSFQIRTTSYSDSNELLGINQWNQFVGFNKFEATYRDSGGYSVSLPPYATFNGTNLNSLIDTTNGWILRKATAINDWGQIVGIGELNGQQRAFMLTPKLALDSVAFNSQRKPVVTVVGADHQVIVLQTTSNLTDWISVATNQISGGSIVVTNREPVGSQNFYRALRILNSP